MSRRRKAKDRQAVSLEEIISRKFNTIGFDGEWEQAFGDPEKTGCWEIWGESGSGKTTFLLRMSKYLISKGLKVVYNTLEEGVSESFKQAIIRSGIMSEERRRFMVWDKLEYTDMIKRIKKQRSPDVIIIDSIQFLGESGFTKADLQELLTEYENKLFIFVSWAKGKQPSGALASAARYKANIKMFMGLDGYVYIDGRYKSKTTFDAWPEKHMYVTLTDSNNGEQSKTD